MQTSNRLYTVEEFKAFLEGLDDDEDYELDRGVLVPLMRPKFKHGRVTSTINFLLKQHVRETAAGEVVGNDSGCVLERFPATVRGPDVAFVSRERAAMVDEEEWFEGSPDLVVEVLSPSNRPGEVTRKVGQYLGAGSRLVWVVDPKKEQVVVYRPEDEVEVLGEGDLLCGAPVLPGFECRVEDIFKHDSRK